MSANNTDMSKIKQVMRMMLQRDERGRRPSNRKIGETVGLYKGTVNDYVKRIEADSLSIEALLELDDPVLERRLCPGSAAYSDARFEHLSHKMEFYHQEMQRPHMTLQQLYEEYKETTANPYSYSQFCYHYSQHKKATVAPTVVMTETREGGREMMVDFAGDKLKVRDPKTGEDSAVELFVSTLPASDYPFAIAVPTQKTDDFIYANRLALEFYGGVPKIIITDNLKSAVIKADRYQPEPNRVFEDFCNHYGIVHVPARARKPRDKALVENEVRIIYNRVYAALRDRVFFSIDDLNEAISEYMDRHRQRRMKEYAVTRQERFLAVDQPNLGPLPQTPFEIKCQAEYTVQANSYIRLSQDGRYYSVPHRLIGKRIKVIYTATILTEYYDGEPVAVHSRLGGERYVTNKDHLPSYHEQYQNKSPQRYIAWAARTSEALGIVMERLFASNPLAPPETFYKSADGIMHMARTADPELMECACRAAIEYGTCTYSFLKRIIQTKGSGLTDKPQTDTQAPRNSDIRGKEYYQDMQ